MLFDVAIVGAGPAGSWTAHQLARRGARVALIDGSHPREKPCGGGVTGRAMALVRDAIGPVATSRIRTARFVDSSRQAGAVVPLDDDMLMVASRTEFDGRLLTAARLAGATLLTSRVVDVAGRAGSFEIATTSGPIRAAAVVGADGANSLVRRRFARPFTRSQLTIATGYFAGGVTSNEIVIELTARPPGYIWSFPRPSHLAIGICTQADGTDRPELLRQTTLAWIQATGIARGARGLDWYSWPIPSLAPDSFRALVTSGPGWYLVGDAAGLVDPLTREGIYYALLSGTWAADALRTSTDASRRVYDERIGDDIGDELARAARYKARFFTTCFARLLLDGIDASAAIRAVVADLVGGCQSYRDLKWRLLKTFEVGLAWKLLTGSAS